MAAERVYTAVPLKLSDQEIHLVEIVSGTEDDIISLKFHRYNLRHEVRFTALSYMWGDANNPRSILVDSKSFSIRDNLWHFLIQARRHGWYDLLWIDALCIDQENVRERNHQVDLMGTIYSTVRLAQSKGSSEADIGYVQASQVAVWLGSAADNSDFAIEKLSLDFGNSRTPWPPDPYSKKAGSDEWASKRESWTPEEDAAVDALLTRKYWTRIWILQEICLAKQIVLHCGSKSTPESALDNAAVLATAHEILNLRRQWSKKVSFYSANDLEFGGNGFRLRSLLKTTLGMGMRSSDVRDMVYALISLLDQKERALYNLQADYSKTPVQIYNHLLAHYLKYEQDSTRGMQDVPWLFASRLRVTLQLSWDSPEVLAAHQGYLGI